jgi:hypothetical protein
MNQGLKSKLWDPFFKGGKNPFWTFQICGLTWYLYRKKIAGAKNFWGAKKFNL